MYVQIAGCVKGRHIYLDLIDDLNPNLGGLFRDSFGYFRGSGYCRGYLAVWGSKIIPLSKLVRIMLKT